MSWYRVTRTADWHSSTKVRSDFAHADVVGRRTVFNIHGNSYRLITRINYRTKRVFISTSSPMSNTARETGSNDHDD
jgi:mRNA interferase HigB